MIILQSWHPDAIPNTSLTHLWRYRIEGDAFIYVDRKTGGTRAILGYPTQKLEQAARSS
jgi:hypothetical protein